MCTIEATYKGFKENTVVVYKISQAIERENKENHAEIAEKIENEDFTIWQGFLYMELANGYKFAIPGEVNGDREIITAYDFADEQPDMDIDLSCALDIFWN